MMPLGRRAAVLTLAVSIIVAGPAWSAKLSKALDPDKDGTIDLTEAKNAASALFDRLDRDHDGTLDSRELRGRLDTKSIVAADPDKDGTIDKNEFLSVVEQRFKAADPDNDGTVDAKELASPAGKALKRLLQ
jgi:Ca2+-binding EF-hand superfamily protein